MSNLQLEMNFHAAAKSNDGNRFRRLLGEGKFVVLIETAAPGKDNDLGASAERLALLEKSVLEAQYPNCALAVTDIAGNPDAWRAAEYAGALSEENRDRHVIYLSGRGTSDNDFQELLQLAANAGISNLVPVTGNGFPDDSARDSRKRNFFESTVMLEEIQHYKNSLFFTGCTTNPFEYTSHALMAEYFKLIKKLHAGASFIVTQVGWDMLKLQSLRWYLLGRNLFYPMIARLTLLTPERVEKIVAGECPGINIPPDFEDILNQELKYSVAQFEAAQYRRLELQAAGCRLLGFSGIQLSGADQPGKAKTAIDRIERATREFTSFEQWLDEYNSYLARAEMAPFSGSFFLYDRALTRQYPQDDRSPNANEMEQPNLRAGDKLRYHLRKFWFANASKQKANSRRVLKKIFTGCKGCNQCTLPENHFICVGNCPKQLRTGSCGGMTPDGKCEFGHAECVYVKILKLDQWRESLTLKPHPVKTGIIR